MRLLDFIKDNKEVYRGKINGKRNLVNQNYLTMSLTQIRLYINMKSSLCSLFLCCTSYCICHAKNPQISFMLTTIFCYVLFSGDVAVGVMGVDFTMPYFFYLLTQDIPDCNIYE